ncbi:MAG: M55 family metallopeptidase [Clostridia bacterium]|nr:M55 family metallopeptidase [Clostridia bacterium]
MNVFILTDLEGIPGVNSIDQMERGTPQNILAKEQLCKWINKTAEYCRKHGAETVYYLDGHGGGGNVFEEKIDPTLIKCSILDWGELLKAGKIDCQIELGAHARAGTIGGFLDHTISSREWFRYTLGGREFSELAIHAALCGAYNVPIVACIGDETACEQAKEYIPAIVTGAVKKASCRNLCQDHPNAEEIVENAVRQALENYRSIPPYHTSLPTTVELTFYRTDFCEKAMEKAQCEFVRLDARTLQRRVEKIERYADLKI